VKWADWAPVAGGTLDHAHVDVSDDILALIEA